MIIQTGMRTDIPAFYSEWFRNRLKDGYVLVRNPYNESQVTRYELDPDVVDLIAFCTKNPMPLLEDMSLLKKFNQYWFVTITPYGSDIEPNVPSKAEVTDSLIALSKMLGVNSVAWRYDPIIVSSDYPLEFHIKWFEEMCIKLNGYVDTCIISFVDLFKKVLRNFPECHEVSRFERVRIGEEFVKIGRRYNIKIKTCGEGDELSGYGVDTTGCMTLETYEKALGCKINPPKEKGKREECACILGNDIGAYNTCLHLCKYCYANYSSDLIRENYCKHNPKSPFLLGESMPGDVIHKAKQESFINKQISIFDL